MSIWYLQGGLRRRSQSSPSVPEDARDSRARCLCAGVCAQEQVNDARSAEALAVGEAKTHRQHADALKKELDMISPGTLGPRAVRDSGRRLARAVACACPGSWCHLTHSFVFPTRRWKCADAGCLFCETPGLCCSVLKCAWFST